MPVHIHSKKGDVAPTVLLVGNPDRAAWLAKHVLTSFRVVTRNRGLLGLTGSFHGFPVSIQATGMGAPSASIVMEELIQLGGRRFIRIGTCGSLGSLKLGDILYCKSAFAYDGATRMLAGSGDTEERSGWPALEKSLCAIDPKKGLHVIAGSVATADLYYNPEISDYLKKWKRRGAIAVDMETSVVYRLAALYNKQAASVLVVSDTITTEHGRIQVEYASARTLTRTFGAVTEKILETIG